MLHNLILVAHVLIAMAIIGLVLLQQGKGADAGAAFGSGASSTVFGARGSGSFLTRMTGILAALFFATSLTLAYLATGSSKPASVVDKAGAQVEAPADTEANKEVPAETPSVPVPATD